MGAGGAIFRRLRTGSSPQIPGETALLVVVGSGFHDGRMKEGAGSGDGGFGMLRDVKANAPTKRRYQKPEVVRVKLVTEEAVLTSCKLYVVSTGPKTVCSHPVEGSCWNPGS